MISTKFEAIERILKERFSLSLAYGENHAHTDLQLTSAKVHLEIRSFENWYSFELIPLPLSNANSGDGLFEQLLRTTAMMRFAKFGLTPDGNLTLSSDIPARNITEDRLVEVIDLLKGYAELYILQLEQDEVPASDNRYGVAPDLLDKGIERLLWHIRESPQRLDYSHETGGKLPRNHIYRPYRFCVQDVLFGATVVRHARELNCLEVDVFLPVEIPQYAPDSGVRWLAVFLLSEAYKCGGSMEIQFTKHVGNQIPSALCQLAMDVGSPFSPDSIRNRRVSPKESRELYANLTGFSDLLRNKIEDLDAQARLSIERVCYSIHHGVWTLPEIESIVISSPYPDAVLSGEIQPEQRHLYSHVLFQARSALLGGFLDRKIVLREHTDETGGSFNLEDDERYITVEFLSGDYAKRYTCPEEPLPIPWAFMETSRSVEPNESLVVLVRARDVMGIKRHLMSDIDSARNYESQHPNQRICVLVPFDFQDPSISEDERQAFFNYAQSNQVGILVCPETTFFLDNEVRSRLMSSRIMRE